MRKSILWAKVSYAPFSELCPPKVASAGEGLLCNLSADFVRRRSLRRPKAERGICTYLLKPPFFNIFKGFNSALTELLTTLFYFGIAANAILKDNNKDLRKSTKDV
jgi:hypothetical protein